MKVKISNTELKRMLNISKRKQTVNGKQQAQVESCVLLVDLHDARITSLTRDLTGLTGVVAQCESDKSFLIPIPDIDRVLGVIALHGEVLTISYGDNKLLFKSAGKRTTLDASLDAKAFTHTQETISEFYDKSMSLAAKVDAENGIYHGNDGNEYPAFSSFEVNVRDLYDACRCDTINGQRLNRYTLEMKTDGFYVTVGDPSLGQTESKVDVETTFLFNNFKWNFDGGLDELFKGFTGKVKLNFFDFREHGQGIRFSASFGNGEYAFQSGMLG
tara:strand:- start:54 stop:872 length:819 start_codon:yes stop_codon:yes gene_type:complete